MRNEHEGAGFALDLWAGAYGFRLRWTLIFFALFALIYGAELFHFSLSIDEELAFTRSDPSSWVGQGRWGIYLLERFLLPNPTMPLFPLASFGFLMAFTTAWASDLFRLQSPSYRVLAFCLVASSPSILALTEFSTNVTPAGIAITGALGCAVLQHTRRPLATLLSAVGLAIIISLYQSTLFLFAAFSIGLVFQDLSDHEDSAAAARRLLRIFGVSAAGFVLYELVQHAFQTALAVPTAYIQDFIRPDQVIHNPGRVLRVAFWDMRQLYGGLWTGGFAFDPLLGILLAALLFLTGASLLRTFRGRPLALLLGVFLVGSLLLLPFTLHFLSTMRVPYRSMLALPFVFWMLLVSALPTCKGRWREGLLAALLVFVVLAQTQQVSRFFYAARLVNEHDRLIAARLSDRIDEAIPAAIAASKKPVPVYVSGMLPYENPRAFKGATTTAGSSFFEWDGGSAKRVTAYLRMLGFSNLVAAPDEQRDRLEQLAAEMPSWPVEGSVSFNSGTLIIKFPVPRPAETVPAPRA